MSTADAFLAQASQHIAADRWEAAEGAFAEAVATDAGDVRGHGGLALCAIRQEDWELAVARGRTAASLPGASTDIHNNLGWALEQGGNKDEALTASPGALTLPR